MNFRYALLLMSLSLSPACAQSPSPAAAPAKEVPGEAVGYSDTPALPGQPWRVHDISRPHPPKVTPGATPGAPPSDAIVLFDGKDLSKWAHRTRGGMADARWKIENGAMFAPSGAGDLITRESFGDIQLHVEWAVPAEIQGKSQNRGNSGVIIMGYYEIQVLDSWENPTYADGQAGAMYGQYPPLVNASKKPGEWQTYDIVFEAPRFKGDQVERPATATVFHNGVLLHNRQPFIGRMTHRDLAKYAAHEAERPLLLQDHGTRTQFRNIWVRRLKPYDPK